MKKVHLICNAHIDPIWQWDWQEGVSAAMSTFRTAVELAEECDYIFCHNEVTLYKFVEEYAPELFESIRALVKEGKWRIMGGWYLQPDCNMPCGESFVRQILKGKEYFTEKFGVFPKTAINFDPFGHTKGLVQIIQKCGQDSYIFMRPYPRELSLPSEQFVWKGFADSSIKANRAESYNTPLGGAAKEIKRRAEAQPQDVVCVLWGVGNHGGGPSRQDLADIKALMDDSDDIEYVHSCPEQFFAQMRAEAEFDKSLRISMPGCYTSMGKVKRAHVKLENELYMAEKMCASASLMGLMDYPKAKFGEITEDLLNAEFHDTLPGTCIESGEGNALNYLSHGLLDAERLKTRAFFAMLKTQKRAASGEYPIFVYNACPKDITENVECEFILADQNWSEDVTSEISLYDCNGNPVKYQLVKEESNLNLDWRKRIAFEADLKAFSLNRFSLFVEFKPSRKRQIEKTLVFDNGRKHVEISRKTGLIESFRIDGIEYLKGGISLVSMDDNADPWGMAEHQLARIGTDEKPFSLEKTPKAQFNGLESIQVVENGDIYLGVEAFFVSENTRARVLYKIYKNNDNVDVSVNLFVNEINKIYKLKIPFNTSGKLIGQTAFGEEELFTDGRENVSQRYIRFGDGSTNFAVMNNCVYGSSFEDGNLYINLARAVTYCAHPINDRQLIPTDRFVKKIDQGQNDFAFRLTVAKTCDIGGLSQIFNQKPYAVNAFPLFEEPLKSERGAVEIENNAITLEAFKMAESKNGYLLRLFNNTDETQETAVIVGCSSVSVQLKGYEIKNLIYSDGIITEVEELII